MSRAPLAAAALAGVALLAGIPARAQDLSGFDRQRGLQMLGVVRDDITGHYFDTLYAGKDLPAVFDTAAARIRRAVSMDQVLGIIAQAAASLDDSHTIFLPPGLRYDAEYGWTARFVGDTCRVLTVVAGSDAEAKGMQVGDALLQVEGIDLDRSIMWQLEYLLHALRPRPAVRVLLRSAGAPARSLEIGARMVERRSLVDLENSVDLWELIRGAQRNAERSAPRLVDLDGRVAVFRLPAFHADFSWIDWFAKQVRGREAVVIDLRGNHGGAVDALLRFVGLFFEQDQVVADVVERRKRHTLVARGAGKAYFAGKVVVLTDAESGSAAELFARSMQLAGRGTVLGDRSAGAVRVSRFFTHLSGSQIGALYGTSVTVSDVIMPDGGRLERTGVIPDEPILPTGEDLRRKADPVLARALALAGIERTPEQAGRLPWEP